MSFAQSHIREYLMKIALFNKQNLAQCPWPDTNDGWYAKEVLTPLVEEGVSSFISNISTNLYVLVCDSVVIPITVNEAQYENAHVCSPYGYFIAYAEESLDVISSYLLKMGVKGLMKGLKQIAKKGEFNKVVLVNNWFFSINVYPQLTEEHVQEISHFLKRQFPEYAIVFRSVDSQTNPQCFQTLKKLGFTYIAAKQILYLQGKQTSFFESRLYKSDLKLLDSCGYEIVEGNSLASSDMPRLLELYHSLYIEKYSSLNPQFDESFVYLMWKKNLLHFLVLKKEGRIDGVIGYLIRNEILYCPFFGYDTSLPKEPSLYRILSTLLMKEVQSKRLFFHQSSGASTYKKMRKAESCIEYTVVLHDHLPLKRRIPWWLIAQLYNRFGIKYMSEY